MVARPIDAAEGYRLFQQAHGAVSLDEINEYLRGLGLLEVSPRMLVHYERLYRHGYSSYIPINRLDIALAGEDAWSAELQARYPEIAQPTDGEAIWDSRVRAVKVLSLGVSTATVTGDQIPQAGAPIVLRLLTTGIERNGTVSRSDRNSGRFHIAFDPYTSVPLAPADSPITGSLRVELLESAENLVAIGDIILNLDRFLVRADPSQTSLTRVRSLAMRSPIEILIIGGLLLDGALRIAEKVIRMRKDWHEGTKAAYESQGIRLDNEERTANAQMETDAKLKKALQREVGASNAPLLESLQQPHLPLGDPGSPDRQQLSDAAQAAVDLPWNAEIGPIADRKPTDESPT